MNEKRAETSARELALKFLYQCETVKLYYFSESHFNSFFSYIEAEEDVKELCRTYCSGAFNKLDEIDQLISETSKKWSLDRMATIDKSILRIATGELLEPTTPVKVILNEAVELAKIYGTEHSSKFVNGLLDTIAHRLRKVS